MRAKIARDLRGNGEVPLVPIPPTHMHPTLMYSRHCIPWWFHTKRWMMARSMPSGSGSKNDVCGWLLVVLVYSGQSTFRVVPGVPLSHRAHLLSPFPSSSVTWQKSSSNPTSRGTTTRNVDHRPVIVRRCAMNGLLADNEWVTCTYFVSMR